MKLLWWVARPSWNAINLWTKSYLPCWFTLNCLKKTITLVALFRHLQTYINKQFPFFFIKFKMKLISLSTVGIVLADSGLRSELTSIYGSKAMIKREQQSRKMGYEQIGSNMQARKGNSLCSLRSKNPQFQCCDGVDFDCFGCNAVLLDQGQ